MFTEIESLMLILIFLYTPSLEFSLQKKKKRKLFNYYILFFSLVYFDKCCEKYLSLKFLLTFSPIRF